MTPPVCFRRSQASTAASLAAAAAGLVVAITQQSEAWATPPSEKHEGINRKGIKNDLTPLLRKLSDELKVIRDRLDPADRKTKPAHSPLPAPAPQRLPERPRYGAGARPASEPAPGPLAPFLASDQEFPAPVNPMPTSSPTPAPVPPVASSTVLTESDAPSDATPQIPSELKKKTTTSVAFDELTDSDSYPPRTRRLIEAAIDLTRRNLVYKYGSADPESGGMDCSGFIYWLLKSQGIAGVPRSSHEQYVWVRKSGSFFAVLSRGGSEFEIEDLKPGDLLFWTGTYKVERDIPVTHVMVYLGTLKQSGRRVMAGASEGRTFGGQPMFGVSVFDFHMGKRGDESGFVGYGRIPESAWPTATE